MHGLCGQACDRISFWPVTLTGMMAIPKTPCPVRGLVPWGQGIWPIVWRGPHPVLGWIYTIHEKPEHGPLQVHWNVSQADIVRAMEAFAAFKPHQRVPLGPTAHGRIVARKWSFERGSFFYLIQGARAGSQWSVEQSELLQRVQRSG